MRFAAKRTRHLEAVPIGQPTVRAIARVAARSLAIKIIRAPLAMLRLQGVRQNFELDALIRSQQNRGRFRDTLHASLNYDLQISEVGY
jgi:hypothetical protein